MKKIVIKLIRFYKGAISPFWAGNPFTFLNSVCRFHPTCSDYAIDAISTYGVRKGVLKAINRVLRCNPFSKPWIDKV
ncbi:MAG: membrane protein insertion efficiency factor YidD [Candidatus Yanofskybacteria bacterium]|nr:membrane protein insertion efficiency factor YidD [Candidatus Yanofskybacteria bacterium]